MGDYHQELEASCQLTLELARSWVKEHHGASIAPDVEYAAALVLNADDLLQSALNLLEYIGTTMSHDVSGGVAVPTQRYADLVVELSQSVKKAIGKI